jgi:hypothetical protein
VEAAAAAPAPLARIALRRVAFAPGRPQAGQAGASNSGGSYSTAARVSPQPGARTPR